MRAVVVLFPCEPVTPITGRSQSERNSAVCDIISVPRIHGGYPAEKPVAVSEVLVRQSSEPGQLVADPFMGSGSVGIAALRLGRRFTGTDLNPQAVRVTAERLREFGEGRVPADITAERSGDQLGLLDSLAPRT